ncbi:MAG TPA: SulP family inorganic anion transporter [Myxococcota bacterium]|nr:SulP family inorganic anion transporter [Myxococcota bacterium]
MTAPIAQNTQLSAPAHIGWRTALRDPRVMGHDLVAGLTVGLVSIPQAMAFALIAGVPPQVALLTMIVPGFVAGFFRDSPHLASGATNTAALLVGGVLATTPLVPAYGQIAVLSGLCVIVGLIKCAVGFAGLGRLSRYVSPAVVLGFTLGAAALLCLGQLPNGLGIHGADEKGLLHAIAAGKIALRSLDSRAVALTTGTVAVIALASRAAPRVPAPLLALIAGALATHAIGWGGEGGLLTVGSIPSSFPRPSWPALSPAALATLFPAGLAIALVGMSEVVSIGKAIALRTGQPLHADQELRAQGFANLASSLFPCLPSSVSWTRSAASIEAGARSPASVTFASLTVLVTMLFAAPLARFVPLAAVAGVVIWIAVRMVSIAELRRVTRSNTADLVVLLVTAALTLTVDLHIAVFGGVALSLGLVISRASLLRVSELQRGPAGFLVERPIDEGTGREPIAILQAEGDLFFGVADELEQRLATVAHRGARGIVLRLKRTLAIDGAAAAALARFAIAHRARGGVLALCGLRPELEVSIARSDLAAALGRHALFETSDRPFASLAAALREVQDELGLPPGLEHVRTAETDLQGDAADSSWSV